MKARLTSGGIPQEYKKDIDRIFRDYEQRYQNVILERMMGAMLLTVNDLFGFGRRRMERLLAGFQEIIHGYNEDAYDGVDKHLQTMETMNRLMRDELASRGIEISQNHGNIIIRTANRKGHKDG